MSSAILPAFIFLAFSFILGCLILVSVRAYQIKPEIVTKSIRYVFIGIFWGIFSVGSVLIGLRISDRHVSTYSRGEKSVSEIWGGAIVQSSPSFYFTESVQEEYTNEKTGKIETRVRKNNIDIGFESQSIKTDIRKNIRTKGLLKFPGYAMSFNGVFKIKNETPIAKQFLFEFPMPEAAGNLTSVKVSMDGADYRGDTSFADGVQWSGVLAAGESKTFQVLYTAQGTSRFTYVLSKKRIEIHSLEAEIKTDYEESTIPDGAMVFTKEEMAGSDRVLRWNSNGLVTGQDLSVQMEMSGNYGSQAAKLFFYSPISMLLFVGFLLVYSVARENRMHPMHYLFILASFFIFYLLGSYLFSYVHIIIAIVLSLAVSTAITLYYVFLTRKELMQPIGGMLVVFQWIFSAAFFFPEHTGLLITVAGIAAFVGLIRFTSSTDWEKKF